MNKHLLALELDKVLARLAEFAACPDAKEAALALRPETELLLARALMRQTQDAHMLLARFGGPSFGGLKNVSNALRRADAGSVLNMRELLDIAGTLRAIRALAQWRDSNAGVESVLDTLFGALTPNKYLEDAITGAILTEEEMSDNASPELAAIRRKIRVQEARIREQLEKMTRSSAYSKYLQENIVTMRGGRYVVPVKAEHRADVPGLVHDTSASGATVFIEPMAVVTANNEIKVLQSDERDEIDRILSALSVEAGNFCNTIEQSYEAAVELNLIFAKAQLAYSMKAAAPELNDSGVIDLRAARHPLIDPKTVVPVDIRLGEGFNTLVITGPNTGGKTVSIKTLGLLSLMAMCGLMLPVRDQSRISVFREVLADIGDEQSIEQSLSTFSAHMTNIIDILERANDSSLVLIDELGAGTDPIEGAALAMAVLEYLAGKGAHIAATTHYAELKAYALQTPGVENACCEFDVQTLRPTYRLLIGVPGRSNAFAISERLGMPLEVVDRARALVDDSNIRFEDVVDQLELSRLHMEKERENAAAVTRDADAALLEAQKLRQEAIELKNKELENAKAQALRITEQARREANALLMELEKLRRERDKSQDAAELARRARRTVRRGIDAIEEAADPVVSLFDPEEDYELPRPLQVGDTVLIASIGKQAKVQSLPDKNGNVEVMAGSVKMRVRLAELRLVTEQAKPAENNKTRRVPAGKERELNLAAETRLDLRGMTVEECLMELDRFIDQAIRSGVTDFTVVHGKGTGALRTAVRQYLKKSSYVKTSRPGVYGEGEDGVTIVTLK
ncbi:MAG: endonuclease MutS2 [Clostridia bacterium]|nr:endonuclease MutS2 [Clostridia bacterium]